MRTTTAIAILVALCSTRTDARPTLWYGLETSGTQNDIGTAPQANGTLGGSAAILFGSGPAGFSCACLDLTTASSTGNYVDSTTDVQKIDAMPALTMTMWINLRASPVDRDCLISDMPPGYPPAGQGGWEVRIANPPSGSISASNFSLGFRLLRAMGGYNLVGGADSPAISASSQWIFIAVTYDASQMQRFYQGTEASPVAQFGYITLFDPEDVLRDNSTPLRIGGASSEPSTERTPPAWIDDVRIYNTALSESQLEQVRLENLQMPDMYAVPGFFSIGDLPGSNCANSAQALSADGTTVVGRGKSANGYEAYRWQSGTFTALGDLPGGNFSSLALGVSADGSTVVGYGATADTVSKAFRWQNGTLTDLGDWPGGEISSAGYGVSADGNTVSGYSVDRPGNIVSAFRWFGGVLNPLPCLPGGDCQTIGYGISEDASVIIGSGTTAAGYEAFRYENAQITSLGDLPGGAVGARAYRIAADKLAMVGVGTSASGQEAALWRSGRVWGLGDLPGGTTFESEALGVSAHGSRIVGSSRGNNNAYEAYLWDRQHGMRRLLDVLQNDYGLDLSWWRLSGAMGISNDGGVIAGYGGSPSGYTTTFVAKLPPLPAIADFDGNGHVDTEDVNRFAECATAPGTSYVPLPPGCQLPLDALNLIAADLDWDGDVDMNDFAIFQRCAGGETIEPPDECRG